MGSEIALRQGVGLTRDRSAVPPVDATAAGVAAPGFATPAFAEVYTAEFTRLVRLATLLAGRSDAAHDVVQDAFVQLHLKWDVVDHPVAYVQRSVVNGCRAHHRAASRRVARERRASGAADHPPLDVDHTLATLACLTHRERAIVVLKFYEQRSESEIAELVGCRPGSVGPTVQRALTKLRAVQ